MIYRLYREPAVSLISLLAPTHPPTSKNNTINPTTMPTQQEIDDARKAVNTGLSNSTNAQSLQDAGDSSKRKREANKAERERREKEEAAKAKCMFLSFSLPSFRGPLGIELAAKRPTRENFTIYILFAMAWCIRVKNVGYISTFHSRI